MTEPVAVAVAVTGHHWLLDLSGCRPDAGLLEHADVLRAACLRAVESAGMLRVADVFHQFAPSGVTGVVLLSESHLSVHTWPESGFVALDVYVCDHHHQNRARGQALVDDMILRMRPAESHARAVSRTGARPADWPS